MIQKLLFGSDSWTSAKRALDAGAERQRVVASNLANIETPGYRAKEVAFEEMLRAEETGSKLTLARTSSAHLTGSTPDAPRPKIRERDEPTPAGAINNLSLERETTEMAENTLHFRALSQFLANRYRGIKDAIRPGA